MNPADYCAERVQAAGGDPALIVRFAPAARRASLTAIAALRADLEHLIAKPHDPAIALAKLAWWSTELAGIAGGQAQHPATQALVAADIDHRALTETLLAFTAGIETELRAPMVLDRASWRLFVVARSNWLRLVALGAAAPADGTALESASVAAAELELLATLGLRLAASRPALDGSWNLDPSTLSVQSADALQMLRERASIHAAVLARAKPELASVRPLAVAVALATRRARGLIDDPASAWRQAPHAGLGSLFVAWRAAL